MRYLQHPALANPARWIKSKHASHLYEGGHYDLKSPFVNALLDTKADGCSTRFPRGEMIQLTVEKSQVEVAEKSKKKEKDISVYWIVPVDGTYNSHYIINNRRYVTSMALERKHLRFYPRKLSHRNGNSMKGETTFIPHIPKVVEQIYLAKIRSGLNSLDVPHSQSQKGSGVAGLLLRDKGPLIHFEGSTPIINISSYLTATNLKQDLFIPFQENEDLTGAILRLVNYIS